METGAGAVPIETGETLRKSLPGGSAGEGGARQAGKGFEDMQIEAEGTRRGASPYVAWSYCLPLNSSHTPEGRAQCREPPSVEVTWRPGEGTDEDLQKQCEHFGALQREQDRSGPPPFPWRAALLSLACEQAPPPATGYRLPAEKHVCCCRKAVVRQLLDMRFSWSL